MEYPALAATVPALETLLSQDFSPVPEKTRQDLLVDEFLLKIAKGDTPGAAVKLNALLATDDPSANAAANAAANVGLRRMGAEFFYDHQNPLRAAELFSKLSGERDIARAADALALAGEIPGARNIWLALSSDPNSSINLSRSLYNLAASSTDKKEEASWLEKLFSAAQKGNASMDSTRIYGVIRYTRLLDTPRSIAVLSETVISGSESKKQYPLLDLELLRRRLETPTGQSAAKGGSPPVTWPPNRAAAEVWLLLGRNPGIEALYEWAAWYFDHQKLYDESSRLLKEAARKGFSGPWIELHRSLALIREGKTAEGEKILKDAASRGAGGSQDWRIFANLGRIQEGRRTVSTAIDYYETAATLALNQRPADNTAAAQIQIRLSRCLDTLGRSQESRRALERALELDPDNLNARYELTRKNTN